MPERTVRSKSSMGATYVALLRGINVGGKNMLPMKALTAMFERAGCLRVRHYIQSGNVVFTGGADPAEQVSALVRAEIERAFGLRVPVVIRSASEMGAIARGNPFVAAGADAKTLHVLFLANEPGKRERAALDPRRSPPDVYVVRGREIYLSCPNGVAKTKLSNSYFDSALKTISTARNWRTVLKLAEMSAETSKG